MKISMLLKSLSVFSLALISFNTQADVQYSTGYAICMDNSEGVTANMLDCISAETRVQDARLNRVYQQLMQRLPSEQKNTLRNAQRAWIKTRDKQVKATGHTGGTMDSITSNDKYLKLTTERANQLQARLNSLSN